jgi:hypothetical protein
LFHNGRAFFPVIHYATYITTKIWINEFQSGLLLSLNGLLIFFLDANCEFTKKHKSTPDYSLGFLADVLSFYVLLINIWAGILIVSILFITFGEMFIFPFSILLR